MADYFRSAQAAELATNGKRQSAGQPIEKPSRIKVAGPGAVDDPRYRCGRYLVCVAVGENDAALRTAGQCSDRDMTPHRSSGVGKIGRFVERADLGLVGEQNVD